MSTSTERSFLEAMIGTWHLLDSGADDGVLPAHRVDLAFQMNGDRLEGVMLSRASHDTFPLRRLDVEGITLRIMMPSRQDARDNEPELVLRAIDRDSFEGYWRLANGARMGPDLKLVRAAA